MFDEDDIEYIHNDHPTRLYRVNVTGYHAPHPGAIEAFEQRFPGEDFFTPSVSRTYRSLSGARDRVSLLDYNGVAAEVVMADIEWRLHETKDEKIARLEAEIAEMKRF
ncbi:MAG: hypothetical protein ACTH6N_05910 [Brachybacterium tyrofermentans]|uniref:hypothetical protein n=1 Tax=Brachybacterium tyrofermentans TaxID=47848 RepID=UPI0018674F0D|nr:hypothetical protein [Brachybacterium tyrofermentans]